MPSSSRGSQWRRWDLHIHTPGTVKNDCFSGSTLEEKWNNYYAAIQKYIGDGNNPEKDIVGIGITDYLSIDNYQRVKTEGRLPKSIKLLLPNVEARITPIASSSGINIHFIFNPEIVDELETRFFARLSFRASDRNYTATKSDLIQLGRKDNPNCGKESAYKRGIGQFLPNIDNFKDIFDTDKELRENVLILLSNSSNDGVSAAAQHHCYFNESTESGSDFETMRQTLYSFADAIFSSNPQDISFFLGKSNKASPEEIITKCGSLKPCLHGSDAHELTRIFEPDQQRYCWIKADPTFNGLRQVVYEPEERVRISALQPEVKPDYHVIDNVIFDDECFSKEPIFFNSQLNCIIGGKSTGKSILLHNVAHAIDKVQANEKSKRASTSTKDVTKVQVTWADGTVSSNDKNDTSHKIVYIPQLFLNSMIDEKEERTEIDNIIQEIVLTNEKAVIAHQKMIEDLSAYKTTVDKLIYDLIQENEKLRLVIEEKKKLGNQRGIETEIKKLETQKSKKVEELSLSENDVKQYSISVDRINQLKQETSVLLEDIRGITDISSVVVPSIGVHEFSASTDKKIDQALEVVMNVANLAWQDEKNKILDELNNNMQIKEEEQEKHNIIKEALQSRIQDNQAIIELSTLINTEKEKLRAYVELDEQSKRNSEKRERIFNTVLDSLLKYASIRQEYANEINRNTELAAEELEFSVETPFRKDAFLDNLKRITDNRTLKKQVKVDDPDSFVYDSANIRVIIENILNGTLPLVKGTNLENALRSILGDWYNTNYRVVMDDDTIDVMSPGKKALVLLKLLINLAQGTYPILIDQPEDDLDNRSIFDDLIPFIKTKKKTRQIIVVTHNANIVLGGDADEVIVANQHGKNSQNKEFQFEYRTGSIENNLPFFNSDGIVEPGILYSQGIQQHICDILEGGEKAFDLRKKKYRIHD